MIKKSNQMKIDIRENAMGGKGRIAIKHLFEGKEFNPAMQLCAKVTIEPGASIGLHTHENDEEIYFIIKGSGIFDEGTGRTPVFEGDAMLTNKGGSHSLEN
ncbi:MAG: cupin domain-containing protein, partial [Fibrobacterota bacterium]